MPWSLRIALIVLRDHVVAETLQPAADAGVAQVGFSVAMRTTSAAMSGLVRGRPGRRVFEPSYFLATSLR
jgi:hypothetical protein